MQICRYNQSIKIYPTHTKTTTFNYPVYNPCKLDTDCKIRENYSKDKNVTRSDSIKRGIDKIYDLSIINDFDYFVTFTLDGSKISRYDYKEITTKLKRWLSNQVARKNCKYLLVPELHKDGAVHFHGLISGNFNVIDSGLTTKDNKIIYNLADWGFGFSTVVKLDDNKVAISRYITKYITKDTQKIFGNFYYAGGKLEREVPKKYENVAFYNELGKEFQVGCTSLKVKYYELGLDKMNE